MFSAPCKSVMSLCQVNPSVENAPGSSHATTLFVTTQGQASNLETSIDFLSLPHRCSTSSNVLHWTCWWQTPIFPGIKCFGLLEAEKKVNYRWLFSYMSCGHTYILEDTQTSVVVSSPSRHSTDTSQPARSTTTVHFGKQLTKLYSLGVHNRHTIRE